MLSQRLVRCKIPVMSHRLLGTLAAFILNYDQFELEPLNTHSNACVPRIDVYKGECFIANASASATCTDDESANIGGGDLKYKQSWIKCGA